MIRKVKYYFQARPNVTFELGWFCAYRSRKNIMMLLQEGTDINAFSDFQGLLKKCFSKSIVEIRDDIKKELKTQNIIT